MQNQIRADFDGETIVVYQAFSAQIALPSVAAKRFVAPFSLHRMTWIKPSFLWLMERSDWGLKSGQEHILAVRITRAGWEEALSLGILTHPEPKLYPDSDAWRTRFEEATVHIQWDPERSLRGAKLERSIQVGISRHLIERYVDEWITDIIDLTPRVRKMHDLLKRGQTEQAKRLLPAEHVYRLKNEIARRIGVTEIA
ncbi:MAG: DUF4291 domain-containing protein [Akkermansiaceae bacterium]|nr:DUF4291 domain-containing protein [Armatimonadota bacterium]